jgi:hypothetical protein
LNRPSGKNLCWSRQRFFFNNPDGKDSQDCLPYSEQYLGWFHFDRNYGLTAFRHNLFENGWNSNELNRRVAAELWQSEG